MSKGQTLRVLVNERLNAAAEEIFALFERTIAEYEEELCRYREENQVKRLLDREESQRQSTTPTTVRPDPGLCQEITETPWIKEETEDQKIKEELPEAAPEFTAVMKSEEFSLVHGQTEHRGENDQEQTFSAQTYFHPESEGHIEPSLDEWGPQLTCSCPETEADGENYRNFSETDQEQRHCLICKKIKRKDPLQYFKDIVERPFSCSFCTKTFAYKYRLDSHRRTHTGEKPFKCSFCEKHFAEHSNLKAHLRTHTGERPYSCSACDKTYRFSSDLKTHMRTHTGEKPFRCSHCTATFRLHLQLKRHMSSHTGGKPYSCSICDKTFHEMYNLKMHMRGHTGERPYSCSMCDKTFAQLCHLKSHLTTHTGGNTLAL